VRPPALARSVAVDLTPLRDSPAYRALWSGQIVSLVGMQMRFVVIPWQVFELTQSTLAVGLVGLAELVPLVAFTILGGALADSSDRRTVMLRAQTASLVVVVALAALSLQSRPPIAALFALAAAASACSALDRPAWTAMVPTLVRADQVASAMALRQIVFQVTHIVGPALAGVLLATFDVAWVYVVDALTVAGALTALRWVPSWKPGEAPRSAGLRAVREGLRFALGTRVLLGIFTIDLVAMIFGMPRAVFPALAEETFRVGPTGLGWLYAAPAVGALGAALVTGWVRYVQRQGTAVLLAVTAWGTCVTLAGLSLDSFAITLAFLALAGAADVVSAIFRGTMLQQVTPDPLRGRLSAANLVVVSGGPRLGDIEAGVVAHLTSPAASVVIGGIGCLLGTAAVATAFDPLRSYRAPRAS
jgi:MFS family permease